MQRERERERERETGNREPRTEPGSEREPIPAGRAARVDPIIALGNG
jgi:hypothetical protein